MANRLEKTEYPPNNEDGINELHRIDLFILLDLLGTKTSNFYNYFKDTKDWYSRLMSFEQRLLGMNLLKRTSVMFQNRNYYNGGIEDDHIPFLKRGKDVLFFGY